jgi:hypothetical protein
VPRIQGGLGVEPERRWPRPGLVHSAIEIAYRATSTVSRRAG